MSRRTLFLVLFLASTAPAGTAQARDVPGYGTVSFPTSCSPAVQAAFETAVARMHDFDGAERDFREVAASDPRCAIAWWGAAMAVRGNPLIGAPAHTTLEAGKAYIANARAAGLASPRESGLIDALGLYFRDPDESHVARTVAYEAAMRKLAALYPDDAEVQCVFALAILEAVDLTDKSLARQREAGSLLERVWAENPNHPGAVHYLIHAYDYPSLAAGALAAARRYSAIAPAGMHAQHMPAHIYSMLGLWQESIAANHAAARLTGHAAEPMAGWMDAADPHGMDFIAYAHLQIGQDDAVATALALAGRSEERTLVTARYLLERRDWRAAAVLPIGNPSPREAVTLRFVRALGAARLGDVPAARSEIAALEGLHDAVLRANGAYWAGWIDVYAGAADAWATFAAGDTDGALRLMSEAAERDDGREKHILLENKLLPMRELYGELLLAAKRPEEALAAFTTSMALAPNRFNGLLGAARAAQAAGLGNEAQRTYAKAAALVSQASPGRPEIEEARRFSASRL